MPVSIHPELSLPDIRRFAEDHLALGVVKRGHPFREVVLATSAIAGPDLRTVINRRVVRNPLALRVYTDHRSAKVRQLKANPMAAMLFWHPGMKLQLKIYAEATLHHMNHTAAEAWKEVRGKARESYTSKHPPGATLESGTWSPAQCDPAVGSQHFVVIDLEVKTMEVLQLRNGGHIRAIFEYHGHEVSGTFIVP